MTSLIRLKMTNAEDPNLRLIKQWRYRESFYHFFLRVWKVLEPIQPLVDNWHLKYFCDFFQAEVERIVRKEPRANDWVINVSPASTKSTVFSVAGPVWAWVVEPSLKIISVSYADTLANYLASKSRDIILSDWFQDLYGDTFSLRMDVNKKSEYANDKGGFRYAIGAGGSAIGRHADIIIGDDLINPKKAVSSLILETMNDWWDNYVATRMTNPDVTTKFLIMQRLATRDLSGHCLSKGSYGHICLPAELLPEIEVVPDQLRERYVDGLFDVKRLSRTILNNFRKELGSAGYSAQMLQNPIPPGGFIFKREWFGEFTMEGLIRKAEGELETITWNFVSDTAYTEKTLNDPTAFLCYAWYHNDCYIRDYEEVYLTMPDLIKFASKFALRNEYGDRSVMRIEPKASGISLIQMLRANTELNVRQAAPPVVDKIARANLIAPLVECGRVKLLSGSAWREGFIKSVIGFPRAAHDEAADCLFMALKEKSTERPDERSFGMRAIGG